MLGCMAVERDLEFEAKPVLAILSADLKSHAIDGIPVVLLSEATQLIRSMMVGASNGRKRNGYLAPSL